jgi:predicted dehydrogenase
LATTTSPLRIGTLGAARITVPALIEAAKHVPEVQLVAVAARDAQVAQAYARTHAIPKTHASYEALLADPDIDAIYNPLPNSLHGTWSMRAMRAGKHVLCEKPFASNAAEAAQMAQVARETGRVISEAFAWRHHPIANAVRQVIHSGALGSVKHIHCEFRIPLVRPDIRWSYALAGGGLMDVGCYPVSWIRFLVGDVLGLGEPRVLHARAKSLTPQVDRFLDADLKAGDVSAKLVCAMLSPVPFAAYLTVTGEKGALRIDNPFHPQTRWVKHAVRASGFDIAQFPSLAGLSGVNSYVCQLRAFARAVRGDGPVITDATQAIANMRLIDDIYLKVGLKLRGNPSIGM